MDKTVKLFDANNKLVSDFDEQIDDILKSVHGDAYYDVDEPLVDTRLIKVPDNALDYDKEELERTIDMVDAMVGKNAPKIHIKANDQKEHIHFKDFFPVLFFICVFAIIVVAGYYFLNTVDLLSFLR